MFLRHGRTIDYEYGFWYLNLEEYLCQGELHKINFGYFVGIMGFLYSMSYA